MSLNALYNEIRWDTLEKRRNDHKLTLFYKKKCNIAPNYLSSLVPRSVSIISQYNLRNSNDLQTIDARTNQYYNSFLPSSVTNWNNLPVEVRQSASVNSFKQSLNKNKTHVPKYYYSGSRQGQILHVRLRTNCSALNLDLFMRNITDSPLCRCISIEDSQHFFFHCPYFQAPRYDLLNAASQYQTPTLSIL